MRYEKDRIPVRILTLLLIVTAMLFISGCNTDVQIFRTKENPGEQKPVKANELEKSKYYVKDGTSFILTLPLNGSGKNGTPTNTISDKIKERVLYAEPYKDTLIPTHYKGELIAQSSETAKWDKVVLERYKDMGYSIGFFNAKYDKDANELAFNTNEGLIKGTSLEEAITDMESRDIRIVGVNHEALSPDNADFDSGILINMVQGETYIISLYSGTYYHEVEVIADTQMFQSFEFFSYDSDYISDTPNGYRCFTTPETLKSGYYAIDGGGLFRYVDFIKGEGNVSETQYNDPYYENDAQKLRDFSKQFSFSVDLRTKNMSIEAHYNEGSIEDEEQVEGYIFAPDGTEYYMNVDRENDTIRTDFTQTMPGKWTVNIVPMTIEIDSFDAIDNTPDQELTQEEYNFILDEPKEDVSFKVYFTNSVANEKLDEINITGDMIAPDGETYILEKNSEKDLEGAEHFFMEHKMSYAPAGEYSITINHYPERTTIEEPKMVNNEESVTETIVVDG